MEFLGKLAFVTGQYFAKEKALEDTLLTSITLEEIKHAGLVIRFPLAKQPHSSGVVMEFLGKVAFVTGGANGIGAQVCRDLAEAGASVVVADVDAKSAVELATALPTGDGRLHLSIYLDVSKKSEIESALAQVMTTYHRPADFIVNCAGIGGDIEALEVMSEKNLDRMMAVNFKGTFMVTQAFGKALIDAGKPGSIVNISSILAYTTYPGASHYCAAKAAVMQFSKVAAKEWGPKGIRVNTVHPGLIDTAMVNHSAGTPFWKNYIETASLRRVGTPKDVSGTILFLLSSRSAYITGTQIEISGQAS